LMTGEEHGHLRGVVSVSQRWPFWLDISTLPLDNQQHNQEWLSTNLLRQPCLQCKATDNESSSRRIPFRTLSRSYTVASSDMASVFLVLFSPDYPLALSTSHNQAPLTFHKIALVKLIDNIIHAIEPCVSEPPRDIGIRWWVVGPIYTATYRVCRLGCYVKVVVVRLIRVILFIVCTLEELCILSVLILLAFSVYTRRCCSV